jgi:DNA repair exonuclease SbcCD ATPase subunit
MKINSVTINNFLSFQGAYIDLKDGQGLTVIKGKNLDTGGSNGAGKSTVIEAIFFALTGKTIRKSTEATLINNKVKKDCVVHLSLEHDGKQINIKRGKRPRVFKVWVDDEEVTTDHAHNTQEYLNEIFNTSEDVLRASMFFGQSNDNNFLDCTAGEKRAIIKNFLGLDDIFEMRDRIRGYKSEYSSRRKFHEKVVQKLQKTRSKTEEEIESRSKTKPPMSVEDCQNKWEEYHEVKLKRTSLSSDRARLITMINGKSKDTKCWSCGQVLPDSNEEGYKETVKHYNKLLHEVNKKLDDLPTIDKPQHTVAEVADMHNTQAVDVLTNNLEAIEDDIVNHSDLLMKANKGYDIMRYWEKSLSEDGIIKHVIKNVIGFFNTQCNYYLQYLTNGSYHIEFTDNLEENITIQGEDVAYISLSGGEKRKVNLAVMMGLKDLLMFTDKNHPNLLFFDEVAENIDDDGIFGLYQLLLDLKLNKQIFVITHNKQLKTLLESSPRITIEKKNGISKLWHKQI